MEILIRPWRREDFPAVRRILWESWNAAYGSFIPTDDLRTYLEATYQIDSLSRLYDCALIHGLIAEADGAAVGFARTQYHQDEKRLYLASLYLLPAFQKKGIGGRLLKAAEDKARQYGLEELWVGVMVQNAGAGRWYENKGFRFFREEPFRMGRTSVPHRIGCKAVAAEELPAGGDGDCFAVYDGAEREKPLGETAAELMASQRKSWPALAEGCAALEAARIREIGGNGWRVKVQFNPRRIASTGAKLDPESIRRRPCFLCRENRPRQQEAILYRREYLILCNPAPIFPMHLTIVHRRHLPQSIEGTIPDFLRLAADLGPAFTVLYNGPRCGASAPDHLHFQAAPAGLLPAETEVLEPGHRIMLSRQDGVSLWRSRGLQRGILVIEGRDPGAVAAAFNRVSGALRRLTPSAEEPLLNLLGVCTGDGWRLLLFPRRKLRPAAYDREGEEQLLVSPGAVDMAGLLITPREKDFLALTGDTVREIFAEVAFDDAAIDGLSGWRTSR